jgi:hypothetical protein
VYTEGKYKNQQRPMTDFCGRGNEPVFQNEESRKIPAPKKEELRKNRRIVLNEELCNVYSSHNILWPDK